MCCTYTRIVYNQHRSFSPFTPPPAIICSLLNNSISSASDFVAICPSLFTFSASTSMERQGTISGYRWRFVLFELRLRDKIYTLKKSGQVYRYRRTIYRLRTQALRGQFQPSTCLVLIWDAIGLLVKYSTVDYGVLCRVVG